MLRLPAEEPLTTLILIIPTKVPVFQVQRLVPVPHHLQGEIEDANWQHCHEKPSGFWCRCTALIHATYLEDLRCIAEPVALGLSRVRLVVSHRTSQTGSLSHLPLIKTATPRTRRQAHLAPCCCCATGAVLTCTARLTPHLLSSEPCIYSIS